jgi:hypothetical protein
LHMHDGKFATVSGEINEENLEGTLKTYSHISNDSRQDASTTHAHHMDLLIKPLKEDGRIKEYVTKFLEETSRCSKQHRCATARFLLSLLASAHKIVINRAIGVPGYDNDEADGLDTTDKKRLSEKMSVIYEPKVKEAENQMALEARENGKPKSFACECVCLCAPPDQFEGVKSERKSKKHEDNSKMRLHFYHEQKTEDLVWWLEIQDEGTTNRDAP